MDGWTELARACTATGDLLVLREQTGIVELRCNGWELMSNRAHHSEAALAVLACERIARTECAQPEAAPPPLEEGGWGEGCPHASSVAVGTPPPNPLPQGEGEQLQVGRQREEQQYPASTRPYLRIATAAPRLLIGGLGLGYTLRAVLDHLPRSARVIVAELLPEIIAWNRGPLAPLAGHPLADPRVSVACADVAALLRAAEPACFDAVLLDTDNGPDAVMLAGNASLYGPESLRLIRRALRPAGTLAVWSADPSPHFEHNLRHAGFQWDAHAVPARGAPDDPLHTIYLAWEAA